MHALAWLLLSSAANGRLAPTKRGQLGADDQAEGATVWIWCHHHQHFLSGWQDYVHAAFVQGVLVILEQRCSIRVTEGGSMCLRVWTQPGTRKQVLLQEARTKAGTRPRAKAALHLPLQARGDPSLTKRVQLAAANRAAGAGLPTATTVMRRGAEDAWTSTCRRGGVGGWGGARERARCMHRADLVCGNPPSGAEAGSIHLRARAPRAQAQRWA